MKLRLLFILPLWLVSFAEVFCQTYSKDEIDRMVLAYTFYIKQAVSLEAVSLNFPALKEHVDNVTAAWDREFGSSVAKIDTTLGTVLQGEWSKQKSLIYDKFQRADNTGVSETNARQFIEVVNARAAGRIQSPILETYLMFSPAYQQSPELELSEGYTRKIRTRDLTKIYPLNVQVILPKSWKEIPVIKKSDVLFRSVSGFGFGSVVMSFGIEQARKDFSAETVKQLLSEENLKKGLATGDKFLAYNPNFVIDNCPAASVTYTHTETQLNTTSASLIENYAVYYKNYHIAVTFVFSTQPPVQEDLTQTYERYRKLLKKIMDNVVILSQWGL